MTTMATMGGGRDEENQVAGEARGRLDEAARMGMAHEVDP